VRIQPPPESVQGHHDRPASDPNRWVRQRWLEPRGGRWQVHHPSNRGR
jgi:hypothetical protein